MIIDFLADEIAKTFRAIQIRKIDSKGLNTTTTGAPAVTAIIYNRLGDEIIEFGNFNGNVHVVCTNWYTNTRRRINHDYRQRRQAKTKMYQTLDPNFVAGLMKDFGNHIRKNQPRGTRTTYPQHAKERHGN